MKRGTFIAFEGIDGCGKTTQLARAAEHLRHQGRDVLATREPTDGLWGRRIRAMARSSEAVDPITELEWFIQDRSEHVRGELEPALAAGRTILCDRYILSTVAYQGARAQAAPDRWSDLLDDQLARFPEPDLALVFVLEPGDSLARTATRGDAAEPVFEELGFLERVAEIYDELTGCGLPWVERIDARGTRDEVIESVLEVLSRRLAG